MVVGKGEGRKPVMRTSLKKKKLDWKTSMKDGLKEGKKNETKAILLLSGSWKKCVCVVLYIKDIFFFLYGRLLIIQANILLLSNNARAAAFLPAAIPLAASIVNGLGRKL